MQPSPAPRAFDADRGDHRQRLDRVLVRHLADLPEVSRSRIQGWISEGRVVVGGRPAARASVRLERGARVEIALPALSETVRRRPEPEDLPLAVLFEDDHLLAVDKPAGVLVHPTPGRHRGTLLNALLARARTWPGDERPRLVQRLDRDTTGVLLVAKSGEAHAALQRVLAAPGAVKEYLAVVYGVPERTKGRIELRLRRHPDDHRKMAASRKEGLAAATRYEVVEVLDEGEGPRLSVLACRLETGRTHQIRVHLAAAGWPLVGDPLYGEPCWKGLRDPAIAALCESFGRQALHARRVELQHPFTRQRLEIEAPIPPDLGALLSRTLSPPGSTSGRTT